MSSPNENFLDVVPGDVFGVPLGHGRQQVGQVIGVQHVVPYVVVFGHTTAGPELEADETAEALSTDPVFALLAIPELFGPEGSR